MKSYSDPVNNFRAEVSPGEKVEIDYSIENDDPEFPITAKLRINDAIPEAWFVLNPRERRIGAQSRGVLGLEIHVPPGVEPSSYRVTVRAIDSYGHELVGFAERNFDLVVAAQTLEPEIPPTIPPVGPDPDPPPIEDPFGFVRDELTPAGHLRVVDPANRALFTVGGEQRTSAESYQSSGKSKGAIYLRFNRANNSHVERRLALHCLEENDASSATRAWYKKATDQNVLPAGQKGFVSCRIEIPDFVEERTYTVKFKVGFDGGDDEPEIISVRFNVLGRYHVKLTVTPSRQTIGPVRRETHFDTRVEAASNGATAARLSVRDPHPLKDDQGRVIGSGDKFAFGPWRTNLGNELGNVHPPSDKEAVTFKDKLSVRRNGIWWFGLWEKREFRIRAVPVTDETNLGEQGNEKVVTVLKWRVLPWPWFFNFAFLILLGGNVDVTVVNGLEVQNGAAEKEYVVIPSDNKDFRKDPSQVTVEARTPWRPLLWKARDSRRGWGDQDLVDVGGNNYLATPVYKASAPFQDGQARVFCLPARGENSLGVFGATLQDNIKVNFPSLTPADKTGGVSQATYTCSPSGAITLQNLSKQYTVQFVIARRPDPTIINMRGLRSDSAQGLSAGNQQPINFQYLGGNLEGQELLLVTSDFAQQVVRIRFIDVGPTTRPEPLSQNRSKYPNDAILRGIRNKNVSEMTGPELKIYLNEPFRRHGAKLTSPELVAFFSKCSGFPPASISTDEAEGKLSADDRKQVAAAQRERTKRGGYVEP